MWLTAFKVALVVFLFVSVAYIVASGMRRSRANRGNPDWTHRNTRPSHSSSLRGVLPAMPRPEWAQEKGAEQDTGTPTES